MYIYTHKTTQQVTPPFPYKNQTKPLRKYAS